jgi:hypothetical protein
VAQSGPWLTIHAVLYLVQNCLRNLCRAGIVNVLAAEIDLVGFRRTHALAQQATALADSITISHIQVNCLISDNIHTATHRARLGPMNKQIKQKMQHPSMAASYPDLIDSASIEDSPSGAPAVATRGDACRSSIGRRQLAAPLA